MAYALDDSWDNCTPVARAGNACFGLYVRCGIWSARNLTDGFVPGEIAAGYGSPEQARKLVDVGLWEAAEGGYRMPDYLERNPVAAKVKARRDGWARKQALFRDTNLREAIRKRDRDMCRYCGVKVRWNDRRGPGGGTYDHVDPAGDNSMGNLVVACRGCNASKSDRTPEQAGMTLLPEPTDSSPTQNGFKSRAKSDQKSPRVHSPTPKGVGGLVEPHPFPVGAHECDRCTMPAQHSVHRLAGGSK